MAAFLCRMPGRFAGLKRFVDYILGKEKVWIAKRIDIAEHWLRTHPYREPIIVPSRLERDEFIQVFGNVFENSAWVADRAFNREMGPVHDTAIGLHALMCQVFRAASDEERLGACAAQFASRLSAETADDRVLQLERIAESRLREILKA